MSLKAQHPQYQAKLADWLMMRHFYQGERIVKEKGRTYLPPTKSMLLDGMGATTQGKSKIGQENYESYLLRAVFPDYTKEAVSAFVGMMHQKPPTIELPSALEALRENATLHGESLEALLRRVNEEQFVSGRLGLLADLPKNPDPTNPMPYIAFYVAESIPNWDYDAIGDKVANLNLVVLDESSPVRNNSFEWINRTKIRVLELFNDVDAEGGPVGDPVYRFGTFEADGFNSAPTFIEADMLEAKIRGKVFDKIPFVFVNSQDIVPDPDEPPLIGLARMCGVIYRGEADFRQNLFMQGQDTLVLSGERKKNPNSDPTMPEEAVRVGAGAMIEMEAGSTADYVGLSGIGLEEQRQAIADDRSRAEERAGKLATAKVSSVESGDALQTRVAAQTATLIQLAVTGAAALERLLKLVAEWMGANPEQVKVVANLEFADIIMDGDTLVKLMTARGLGAPISLESIHALMVDQGLTRLDFETEKDKILEEDASMMPRGSGTDAGGNPIMPGGPGGPKPSLAPGETAPAADPAPKPGAKPLPKGKRPPSNVSSANKPK